MLTSIRNVGLWMLAFVLIGSFTLQADEGTTWQDIFNKLKNAPQSVENMGVNEVMVTITSFPYTQDFENAGTIPTDWMQDPLNDEDWQFGTSATYGATQDHTTGSGYFAWLDDSSPYSDTANILTPVFDFTGLTTPELKFWAWIGDDATGNVSRIYVDVFDSTTQTWHTDLDSVQENNQWEEFVVDLSAYAGHLVQIRFRGVENQSYFDEDMCIDDVFVGEDVTLDWYNLQWPDAATIGEDGTVTVYAQGYKAGVTDSSGAAFGIDCWIGWSDTDSDPSTWTNWVPATFNTQSGNNDEYMADLGPNLPAGTYYYAARWQYMGGSYTYGGYSGGGGGPWDGTTNVSGVLTVTPFTFATIPFMENFDAWTATPPFWSNPTGTDTIGWTLNSGPTVSSSTGPEGDHTTGSGNYLYTEASGSGNPDKWAVLTSPKIYNDGSLTNPYFSLWYHMYGADMGDLHLDIWDNVTKGWTTDVVVISGEQGNIWKRILVDLSTYGDTLQFRIAGKTGSGYWSDIAIDDFEILDLPSDDYAVGTVMQIDGIPDPFKVTTLNATDNETFPEKPGKYTSGGGNGEYLKGGKFNPSGYEVFNNGTPFDTEGIEVDANATIELAAYVQNLGVNSNTYDLHWWVGGTAATSLTGLTGPAFNATDSLGLNETLMLTTGTVTSTVTVDLTGDSNADNDTGFYYYTLVYPENTIRTYYDNGLNEVETNIGFNNGTTPLTAGVRFTATDTIQLAHVDAIYRTSGLSDTVVLRVWSAGADTSAPGSVIYTKTLTGDNYISATNVYKTIPLGDDAPAFMPGDDYWVSLTFDAVVPFPMGAHNAGFTPGRSYISGDDGASWSELVITTERAWIIRSVGIPYMPPTSTVYERSSSGGTLPTWFGSNTERGIACGLTEDGINEAPNERVYVVSRNGGNNIQILQAVDGADVGTLDVTGVSGGTFAVNDVGVSENGKIFVCNLTTNATTSALKVYMWDDENSAPTTVVNWTGADAVRLGDKFTVTGSTFDDSAVLWFASATAGIGKVYKFEMSGGTFNSTPTEITLSDGAAGGSASVGPLPDGSFYWNAGGSSAKKYQADGTLIGTIPGGVLSTGSNAIRYLGTLDATTDAMSEYVVSFQYGSGNENARIMEIPGGDPTMATTYDITPSLGSNSNVGGTGDVDFRMHNNGTATIYVLSTNNGIGAYMTTAPIPVELTSFTAEVNESNVSLSWQTATELNSDRFIVERRDEGTNWTTVGTVSASGTTTEPRAYSYVDNNVASGTYSYRLKIVDLDGSFEYSDAVEVVVGLPVTYDISQNYPNPFNPSTTIKYSLPFNSNVKIAVYNALGELVTTLVDEVRMAGYHEIQWDASRLASGVYIYSITAQSVDGTQDFQGVKKMMLLK